MPELIFRGKEFVYNHHLSVPFRPLIPHADKSIGNGPLDGNLIIHGDNLHALKALLPTHGGKLDCIFIDPPYNTGHEGWSYNDNVNGPMFREWLNGNPITIEDGLRHDKWCAMMYPRIRLLHELLSDNGSIWITLDDNEVHRARAILDEAFGIDCCVGQFAWQKRTSRENRATISPSIDHLVVYSKRLPDTWKLFRNLLPPTEDGYSNPDNDPRGIWNSVPFSAQGSRKNQQYKIEAPDGTKFDPPKGRCWAATEPEFRALMADNRVYWPKSRKSKGYGRPRVKQFPDISRGLVPDTLWMARDVGDTEDSKKQLLEIFPEWDQVSFHAPKPPALIQRVLTIATAKDSIVLDSFAGTGSTAHAVIAQNKIDGGNRKFVLVEYEDYADIVTAERVRRVMNGYSFHGLQREELFRRRLTLAKLRSADKLLSAVGEIEGAQRDRFDEIRTEVRNGELTVTGEKRVAGRADGLGGSFTFCTLGDPLELDRLLTGEALPSFEALGAVLFHMATNQAIDRSRLEERNGLGYLGEALGVDVWLIYRPDLDFLKSEAAALTLSKAQEIVLEKPDGRHLVFAPARFVSQKMLSDAKLPVEFAPLPFALYRIERK